MLIFLHEYLKVNNSKDHDWLKHSPRPPVTLNSNLKFIYVFGDPVNSVISLFRRNFQYPHSSKLAKMNPQYSRLMSPDWTLEDYAREGADLFGFQNHFSNWYHSEVQNDILFVRMETMHQHVEAILDFTGLSREKADRFPAKFQRKSNADALPAEIRDGLHAIYRDFKRQLDSVPDISVKKGVTYSKKEQLRIYPQWGRLFLRECKRKLRHFIKHKR